MDNVERGIALFDSPTRKRYNNLQSIQEVIRCHLLYTELSLSSSLRRAACQWAAIEHFQCARRPLPLYTCTIKRVAGHHAAFRLPSAWLLYKSPWLYATCLRCCEFIKWMLGYSFSPCVNGSAYPMIYVRLSVYPWLSFPSVRHCCSRFAICHVASWSS